ncbi:MAG: PDZ domain-containing protein, partial [Syntrophomonadaceae bacterium]|nr:PDZ domain-containing protein [Syntrophomonadaceae bacterium]
MSILITLIIIAVLILVHEWGHFTAARRIGIPVHEFSLGFGYRLFAINRNGVMYSIRLIPLGGFVRMAGEELGDYEDPKGLSNRTPLEKMRVSFAGPFMNFVLAILIFAYTYTFIGIPQASDQPVVGSIVAGKPAELAGLRPNDEILMVNGQRVGSWTEFTNIIAASQPGEVLELSVRRSDDNLLINVIPELNEATGIPAIGVMNQVVYQKQGIVESIKTGVVQTYELTI